MKKLNNYITEKFQISKDIQPDNNINIIIEFLEDYLNKMILTRKDKKIIEHIIRIFEDWIGENNIQNMNIYTTESFYNEYKKRIKEEDKYSSYILVKDNTSSEIQTYYTNSRIKGETLLNQTLNDQYVKIRLYCSKNIFTYRDSFLEFYFVEKKYEKSK